MVCWHVLCICFSCAPYLFGEHNNAFIFLEVMREYEYLPFGLIWRETHKRPMQKILFILHLQNVWNNFEFTQDNVIEERNTCVATNSNNVTRLFKEFTCCVEEPKVKILKIMCIDFVPLREQLQIENS